jgi:hypothetical protein
MAECASHSSLLSLRKLLLYCSGGHNEDVRESLLLSFRTAAVEAIIRPMWSNSDPVCQTKTPLSVNDTACRHADLAFAERSARSRSEAAE